LLHLVVVGGNFTGVEVAGEFDVFLRDAARRYRNLRREDSHVTLVEIAERILPALDPELSEYAAREMRRRGITVRLRSSVREIHDDHVILESGARLEARTVIWCAGIAPTPVARALPVPVDDLGYILCEGDLRVRGFDCVWAIGDCAVSPGPDGRPYPATAQHALRQGRHLAWNLARVLEGRSTRRFDYSTKGALVALGCRTGVAKVFGLKVSGFAAWFLWRTFYLFQMPGWARRLRVALDWTMDLLFPRDYVQLGVHRGERPKRV
jgi:NADH dehydrogenase